MSYVIYHMLSATAPAEEETRLASYCNVMTCNVV